jgi:hypothetical protein
MRKLAVDHHKTLLSPCGRPCGRPGAPAAACGPKRSPCDPRGAVARAGGPATRAAGSLAFAAVRPGFSAACMVEAAVAEAGGSATAGAVTVPAAGRDGCPRAGDCPARTAGEPSRRLRRRGGGGSRSTDHGHPRRGQRNGQIEHFSQAATRLRKGVRRGAAITPRERADARDLLLTTLGSEPCVQSSIFGFVMT